jgi:hypothetical protein
MEYTNNVIKSNNLLARSGTAIKIGESNIKTNSLGSLLGQVLCWMTGGTWNTGKTDGNYGASGEVGMPGCDYSSISPDPETGGTPQGAVPGWIISPNTPPSGDPGNGGSGGNGTPTVTQPYGGGIYWVSRWVSLPGVGCDLGTGGGGNDDGQMGGVPVPGTTCEGGGGYWESYQITPGTVLAETFELSPNASAWLDAHMAIANEIIESKFTAADKNLVVSYIDRLMTDPNYYAFVNYHSIFNHSGMVWWKDDAWFDFDSPSNPVDGLDNPLINNGTTATILNYTQPSTGRVIAQTTPRGNTEDLDHGRNGNLSGILSSRAQLSDGDLFNGMSSMFHLFTYFDSGLRSVGDEMIQQFRNNSGGTFERPVLNARVANSSSFQNFVYSFGGELNKKLKSSGGDISSISSIVMDNKTRPVFNGPLNKFHGLQILMNDTEFSEIQLDQFNGPTSMGYWSATITVTIHDHFGLDKLDAQKYQYLNYGFADWWLLQHDRDYIPFETIVHVKVGITGQL